MNQFIGKEIESHRIANIAMRVAIPRNNLHNKQPQLFIDLENDTKTQSDIWLTSKIIYYYPTNYILLSCSSVCPSNYALPLFRFIFCRFPPSNSFYLFNVLDQSQKISLFFRLYIVVTIGWFVARSLHMKDFGRDHLYSQSTSRQTDSLSLWWKSIEQESLNNGFHYSRFNCCYSLVFNRVVVLRVYLYFGNESNRNFYLMINLDFRSCHYHGREER